MKADDFEVELQKAIEEGRTPAGADPKLAHALKAQQRIDELFHVLARPVSQSEQQRRFSVGSQIGEFTIKQRLGEGGMGTVFIARQKSLGRDVALKVCKSEVTSDSRSRERFQTEGQALAKLRHPNVVPVLLTGEHEGLLYLVMEYVPGPTLADLLHAIRNAPAHISASAVSAQVLRNPKQYPQDDTSTLGPAVVDREFRTWLVRTLEKVAAGLAEIHQAGIVHRDLKPANIVLDGHSKPKIVDFGLARISDQSTVTVSGEFFGTPAYTSPEQAKGAVADISPASDVFSFGIMLFECLTLRLPFEGQSSTEVLQSILTDDPPLLRRIGKNFPWELEAIADKCLRKNPSDRYPTAAHLAKDLRNYLNLRTISARRTTAIGRFGRLVRRRPWIAAFVATLVLAISLGTYIGVLLVDQEESSEAMDYNNRGHAYSAKGEHDKAIKDYTEAIQLDPDYSEAYYNRGNAYFGKGEHDKAIKDYTEAIRLDPDYSEAYLDRGIAYRKKSKYDKVIEDYTEAIRLDSSDAFAYYNRGNAYSRKGEDDQAIEDYTEAIRLDPNYVEAYNNRGEAYRKKGDKRKARADHDKARSLAPGP